jgi:hypothetical protein
MDNLDRIDEMFDIYIKNQFKKDDLEITMTTMIQNPYIGHIRSLTEGMNYNKVQTFYKNHFIKKCQRISRLNLFQEQQVKTSK